MVRKCESKSSYVIFISILTHEKNTKFNVNIWIHIQKIRLIAICVYYIFFIIMKWSLVDYLRKVLMIVTVLDVIYCNALCVRTNYEKNTDSYSGSLIIRNEYIDKSHFTGFQLYQSDCYIQIVLFCTVLSVPFLFIRCQVLFWKWK